MKCPNVVEPSSCPHLSAHIGSPVARSSHKKLVMSAQEATEFDCDPVRVGECWLWAEKGAYATAKLSALSSIHRPISYRAPVRCRQCLQMVHCCLALKIILLSARRSKGLPRFVCGSVGRAASSSTTIQIDPSNVKQ